MRLTGKQKNKPLWVDNETDIPYPGELTKSQKVSGRFTHFDSLAEYSLFRRLKSLPNTTVQRKAKIILIPALEHLSAITWNIDFQVTFSDNNKVTKFLIEYKGGYLFSDNQSRELFSLKYRLLVRKLQSNEFFYVVTESPGIPCKGLTSVTPNQLIDNILKEVSKNALA